MKKQLFLLIHLNFIVGLMYAAIQQMTTPKATLFFERRLWAYEFWVIFGLYALFLSHRLSNQDSSDVLSIKLPKILKKPVLKKKRQEIEESE